MFPEKKRKNVYLSLEALKLLTRISAGNESYTVEKLIREEAERKNVKAEASAS